MSLSISYKSLFQINLVHHYFLDNGTTHFEGMSADDQLKQLARYEVNNFLSIRPTTNTLKTLKDLKLIYKNTFKGLVIGAKSDLGNEDLPFVPFGPTDKLVFILRINDPNYFNYSDLPLSNVNAEGEREIYYFNNLNNSGTPTRLNLSQAAASPDTFIYTDNNDKLPMHPGQSRFEFSGADTGATIELFDPAISSVNPVFSQQVLKSDTLSQNLDFQHLPSGQYNKRITLSPSATVTNTSYYLNNDRLRTDTFGIVEIYGNQNNTNDYALFNADGTFKSITVGPVKTYLPRNFEIRIKNRSTVWKYIKSQDNSVILQTDADAGFNDLNPLTANGYVEIEHNTIKLPNPSATMIKPENGKIISEIYL